MNPIDENAPPPTLVTPGKLPGEPPSDAVILFDGTDVSQWTLRDGSPARCKVENREMVCRTGDQSIVSKATYASAQLHIEYNVPEMEAVRDGKPNAQVKGNSGVFLHGSYEIQVLDSYNNLNKTYPDGSNASLYRVAAPLVNVSRRPGEWQSYDIILHAPKCQDGKLTSPGDITRHSQRRARAGPRRSARSQRPVSAGHDGIQWSAHAAGSHSKRRAHDGHAFPEHLVPRDSSEQVG